jgi:hypothetical protein
MPVRRSYFVPMMLLGGVLLVLGAYGVYAASLAADYWAERKVQGMLHVGGQLRLQGIWTLLLGLLLVLWALDRRRLFVQAPAANAAAGTERGWDVRGLGFGLVLVGITTICLLQVQDTASDWSHYAGFRKGLMKLHQVKRVLTEKKVPFMGVDLDAKSGRYISVWLEGPVVHDVNGLSGLPIDYLSLRNTAVIDLSPLMRCPLSWLNLRGSPVTDISPLAGTSIVSLDLRETGVLDLRPLAQMPFLRGVHLSREQIMANLQVLSKRDISVQIEDGGPAWSTHGSGWQKEFGTPDVNKPR